MTASCRKDSLRNVIRDEVLRQFLFLNEQGVYGAMRKNILIIKSGRIVCIKSAGAIVKHDDSIGKATGSGSGTYIKSDSAVNSGTAAGGTVYCEFKRCPDNYSFEMGV